MRHRARRPDKLGAPQQTFGIYVHAITFIQDLAVVMLVAGIVTLIFHRLNQPVVLGYILAGIIVGPYTPPFPMVTDEQTIRTLAELGVVFLMFSLGLEFSLRKLRKVGAPAVIAAASEIVLMTWIGYEIGRYFGWSTMDSLFLGAMLSISSTTIIVKALQELGLVRESFTQLVFGILIVEDILAIAIIALLSSIALTGSVDAGEVALTLGRLSAFIVLALVLGILIVPRLLRHVGKYKSNEMLLVITLALCFGFSLLVVKLGYSMALGAFIMGAVMAEAREHRIIARLIEPLRDTFSAIFFVSVGMLLNPSVLVEYAWPVAVITAAVIFGKIATCSLGTMIAGNDGRTSLRVGMSLAQIGEFSFIIAALGVSLNVTSSFLYPIAVAVSVITTFTTPYLIRAADPLASRLSSAMPAGIVGLLNAYSQWVQTVRLTGDRAQLAYLFRRSLIQVFINILLIGGIFSLGGYFARHHELIPEVLDRNLPMNTLLWCSALALSLPFFVAVYRKLHALSLMLAELSVGAPRTASSPRVTAVVSQVIPAASIAALFLLLCVLSSAILPPTGLLVLAVCVALLVTVILWRRFIALHSRLQIALIETLQDSRKDEEPPA